MFGRKKLFIILIFVNLLTLFIFNLQEIKDPRSFIMNSLYSLEDNLLASNSYLGISSMKSFLGYSHASSFSNEVQNIDIVDLVTKINYFGMFNSFLSNSYPDIDSLYLDIPIKSLWTIGEDRLKALDNGILVRKNWTKGKVNFDDNSFKASIRLKGDLSDHWRTDIRKSLDINLKGDNRLFNAKRFSLHKPSARQYPYALAMDSLQKNYGILTRQRKPVNLFINGDYQGVMDFEERPESEFLEKSGKKDSIIFSVGNDKEILLNHNFTSVSYELDFENLPNDHNSKELANHLFHNLIIDPDNSDFVDEESFINSIILGLLWGNFHHLTALNVKYYLNPYTLKAEIIPGDIDPPNYIQNIEELELSFRDVYCPCSNKKKEIFINKALSFVYGSLDIFEINNLFQESLDSQKNIFPNDGAYLRDSLLQNYNFLKENILNGFRYHVKNEKPSSLQDDQIIWPYLFNNNKLGLINITPTETSVEKIFLNGTLINSKKMILTPVANSNSKITIVELDPNIQDINQIKTLRVFFENNQKLDFELKELPVSTDISSSKIMNCDQPSEDLFIPEEINSNQIITTNKVFRNGLIISRGVTLTFKDSANLLVCGEFKLLGTNQEPIELDFEESSGGIFINSFQNEALIESVIIKGPKSYSNNLLTYTGAVNIFNSNATIKDLSIIDAISEDSLNIINSKIMIEGLWIQNSPSDAVDFDFVQGSINKINILNSNGDGIDFSGSNVVIRNAECKAIRDKCISAGEATDLLLKDIDAWNVGTLIASKDGSNVNAENIFGEVIQTAPFLAYNKKPFYGAASMYVKNYNNEFEKSGFEGDSILEINGLKIEKRYSAKDIDDLYKFGNMKK